MSAHTHLVLGGGAAMGAFQAGALLALFEAALRVDLVHGSSVGALNAVFLAVRPDLEQARELARWWADPSVVGVLRPRWLPRLRGLTGSVRRGGALVDGRPLRRLIEHHVPALELSDLAAPVTVTTTCLDCGAARHHDEGGLADLVLASCALPGILRPIRLADGHLHVDGGILDGVPISAALEVAAPEDRVLVLDCGLAPVTGRVDDVLLGRLHDAAALLPLPARVARATRRRIEQVNTAVDEAARWPGVRVLDLGLVPALGVPGGWSVDRIHPGLAGHQGMAVAAVEALRGAGRHPATPLGEVVVPRGSSRSARGWWAVRHGLPYAAGHLREIGAPIASAGLGRR